MWTKPTPKVEGWYWIRYEGKRGLVQCPCQVTHVGSATTVVTARNDRFFEGPNHGGPGLKHINGKGRPEIDSIAFGPRIEEPGD